MTGRLVLATRNPAKLAELRRILEAGQVPVGVADPGAAWQQRLRL